MSTNLQSSTLQAFTTTAREAGLTVADAGAGADFHGKPTTRLTLAGAGTPLPLEVSDGFDPSSGPLRGALQQYFRDLAGRLRTPQPELYVTFGGLPLRFSGFGWPLHRSTSGADTYLVHGAVHLADGTESLLHAKISASLTVTFAEIVAAPEQPYAEDFVYNAIRKTFDYGQLELLKSGNRQPVPVTTRYYSRWGNKFQFTDTTPETRQQFLARKTFWISGGGAPVWLADPRDAQYLNATTEELLADARALAAAGLLTLDGAYAVATAALQDREPEFRSQLAQALAELKPAFNESMRAGQTNM